MQNSLTIHIEGNIASGKTTFLDCFKNNPFYTIKPEPIGKWQNYNGENLLELMYQNPKVNTMKFQKVAQETMFERDSLTHGCNEIVLLERSLYSEIYIFALLALANGDLTQKQYDELEADFEAYTKYLPKPDLIIYLRVAPESCYDRLKLRNRKEESEVSLEYLKKIHDIHEFIYVKHPEILPAPVVVINASFGLAKELCNIITIMFCKRCSKCKLPLLMTNFSKSRGANDGLQNYCKDCRREYQKPYMREKYKDPEFYAIQKYRNRLTKYKKTSGMKLSHNDLLGCSDEFFNAWLQFQRNEREIEDEELDHVLPIKYYKYDPRCWNWKNIRPISKAENRRKSASTDGVEILYYEQLEKACNFLKYRNSYDIFLKNQFF